jgi:hypothetical protein
VAEGDDALTAFDADTLRVEWTLKDEFRYASPIIVDARPSTANPSRHPTCHTATPTGWWHWLAVSRARCHGRSMAVRWQMAVGLASAHRSEAQSPLLLNFDARGGRPRLGRCPPLALPSDCEPSATANLPTNDASSRAIAVAGGFDVLSANCPM